MALRRAAEAPRRVAADRAHGIEHGGRAHETLNVAETPSKPLPGALVGHIHRERLVALAWKLANSPLERRLVAGDQRDAPAPPGQRLRGRPADSLRASRD